jgi:hypothetical protein
MDTVRSRPRTSEIALVGERPEIVTRSLEDHYDKRISQRIDPHRTELSMQGLPA